MRVASCSQLRCVIASILVYAYLSPPDDGSGVTSQCSREQVYDKLREENCLWRASASRFFGPCALPVETSVGVIHGPSEGSQPKNAG